MFTPTTASAGITTGRPAPNPAGVNAWLLWRTDAPSEPDRLTVAELAECRCPDLCDRDHDNE